MVDHLYERIGGRKKINDAVELFYRKVLADARLQPFFAGVDMKHLHARQSMFLSMLMGGEMVYTGREIRAAHSQPRTHGMDDSHFDLLLAHFRAALEELGIASEPVSEIIARLEKTRKDVLNR
jgi:truncated hemoglobin YjbI